jgi:predicted ester cyclase
MTTEENKAILRDMFKAINEGQVEQAIATTHPECTLNGQPFGREGDRIRTQTFLTAFPDQVWTLEQMIAEGEWVSATYTFTGTFLEKMGEFLPTGKQVCFKGVTNYHIQDGQFVEAWEYYDRLALYQQMGLIPATA